MNPILSREQLEHEARAKIFWGDAQETVVHFLRMNGVGYEEAMALTDDMVRERLANVRAGGIRKVVFGAFLIAIPVIAWVLMSGVGVLSIKLLGIAGVFGLWGAWKLLQGSLILIFPENETGDVADQAD